MFRPIFRPSSGMIFYKYNTLRIPLGMYGKWAETCRMIKIRIKEWKTQKQRLRTVEFDELLWYTRNRMQNHSVKILFMLYGTPLWSSGQSSWLHIQRSGIDSRRYHIFWEVERMERGPLSLVSTTEELLERKSSGSGLESQDYGRSESAALTTRHPSILKSWH
jgi:hypothetical protein